MGPILYLTLRQLATSWRLVIISFLALLPMVLAAIGSGLRSGDPSYERDFFNTAVDGLLVGGIVPIVTMVLATTAFGHELEDRTLCYLMLRPLPRWQIALPKFVASVAVGGPLLIASGVVAAVLGLDLGLRAASGVAVAMLAGVVTYAAMFTWAGLLSSRALAFALVYVFLWEGLLSTFLGGVRYLSVRAYALAIMNGIDEEDFGDVLGGRVIELPAALAGAVVVSAVFFWLTVRRLRRMDVP